MEGVPSRFYLLWHIKEESTYTKEGRWIRCGGKICPFMPKGFKGFDSSLNAFIFVDSNPTECTEFWEHPLNGGG
eukprot:8550798-Ditylum_brightwellii.AAC.3